MRQILDIRSVRATEGCCLIKFPENKITITVNPHTNYQNFIKVTFRYTQIQIPQSDCQRHRAHQKIMEMTGIIVNTELLAILLVMPYTLWYLRKQNESMKNLSVPLKQRRLWIGKAKI